MFTIQFTKLSQCLKTNFCLFSTHNSGYKNIYIYIILLYFCGMISYSFTLKTHCSHILERNCTSVFLLSWCLYIWISPKENVGNTEKKICLLLFWIVDLIGKCASLCVWRDDCGTFCVHGVFWCIYTITFLSHTCWPHQVFFNLSSIVEKAESTWKWLLVHQLWIS